VREEGMEETRRRRKVVGGRRGHSSPLTAPILLLVGWLSACAHTLPPEKPTGPPLLFTAGNYDCAAPATWKTTSFAGLVPAVQRALVNDDSQSALTVLTSSHYAEEVTCVAGYVHEESVQQQATATDKALAARRVAATTTWIGRQSARGLTVTNYSGEAH
jgi:hypothetical protein